MMLRNSLQSLGPGPILWYETQLRKKDVSFGTWNVRFEKNEMSGACSTCGEKRGAYRILMGRPEGRRALGRPRRRLEGNIKINIEDVGWGVDWIELAEDRDRWRAVMNVVMNLRVP
jgi:hypothetical protein